MPLDIDRHAHVASSLQRWDPRIKLVSLTLFIFATALLKTIPMVMAALLVALAMLLISRIPLGFVAHTVKWVVLFLLPFFIILPLTYPSAAAAHHFLGMPFALEGLRLAVLIVVKALVIIIIAVAIFGSVRFDIAMIALQRLKCPPVIVQMMLFTYRYIFLFMAEMERMDTAMKARGFVKGPNLYTLKVMGNFVGTLLIRSFERTERIYKAMLSKGYQGEFHTLTVFRAGAKDFIKALLVLAAATALLGGDMAGLFNAAEQSWY